MKKLLLVMLPLVVLFACNKSAQTEMENLSAENERLRAESIAKDSSLNTLFASYNEIEENLAMIKEKERLIRKAGAGDLTMDAKQRITEDLTLIAELMEKNKQTIASLRKKLKDSDFRIGELEKAVEMLTKTIEDKDAEIVVLSSQLASKDAEIQVLADQIQAITTDLTAKEDVLSKQDMELNKAYYVIGTEKELQTNGILTKEGGFVGLGKSRSLSKDFNAQYFIEIDIRKVKTIPINARTARVITNHPSNSYNLIGDKTIEKIEIIDHTNFWRSSKHLVIVVRQ